MTKIPMGTLMSRPHRQDNRFVSTPPSTRPAEAPTADTTVNEAKARRRAASFLAMVDTRANTAGAAAAEAIPCTTRAPIRTSGESDSPPTSEAMTNEAVPRRNTRLRPNVSPIRPPRRMRPPNAIA
jgi:hypothetical protein